MKCPTGQGREEGSVRWGEAGESRVAAFEAGSAGRGGSAEGRGVAPRGEDRGKASDVLTDASWLVARSPGFHVSLGRSSGSAWNTFLHLCIKILLRNASPPLPPRIACPPSFLAAAHVAPTSQVAMWALKSSRPAVRNLRCNAHPILIAARVRFYSVVQDAPIPKKTKVWSSVEEAVKDVKSGDIVLCGGSSITGHVNVCL